ncbi:type-1 angiotensin II receptor-associated protein isoform X3 [Chiloscyllium plagiosum]|uniref:type-1 angiotensin II receptor-associated protein isoform X3 n=1 Tax=Chiloscyllium plagiosum TaxID=36176 RepID=UPI001CB86005|nr:type-1 angiotensin II receptor-associated protein isoform X3 [Chiloscyllium plagiosum]XP_043531810.1 type-1 angiotensin II receptor-associated protein isoform X3 [Chiloscyllium plagiosum]
MALPVVSLKMIIVVHWLLTTWGYLYPWLPQAYLWSNYAVLAIGIWAIAQRDSVDAIVMFLVGILITILMDIIDIAISYDRLSGRQPDIALRDQFRFSVGMAILSLLLKPVSSVFVYQMYKERGGDYNLNFAPSSRSLLASACDSIAMGTRAVVFLIYFQHTPTSWH